jgi:hypothetical protein
VNGQEFGSRFTCTHCGSSIRGKRRNGFCSDRCRMATRREEDRLRRRELLDRLRQVVRQVEVELIPTGEEAVDGR